jgi:hypothetical protein
MLRLRNDSAHIVARKASNAAEKGALTRPWISLPIRIARDADPLIGHQFFALT